MTTRRALILIGITAIAALIVGCVAAIPTVAPADAVRADVALEVLRDGRARYIAKCSGCHALYGPSRYTASEWTRDIEAMRRRARLTDEDVERIAAYLHAFAEPTATAEP